MAEVYRAEQELAAGIFRPAALKVIRPEYSESPDFREMFLDEARTACTLSHQNIVHIYEVGESEGLLYMAMELVAGETLATVNRTLREQGERFSDEAIFAVGIFTCSALEAVHALKIEEGHVNLVHRDVSPHNLLLSSTGTLKLIDFGIAKAATNRNLTNPGVTKGKAGYFSPEQAMGKLLDGRSDLFSLGVTLYKLASGSTPFDAHRTHAERNGALVRGQWQNLEKVAPGLPPGLYEVVAKSLKLKPDDRYANAHSMREALEKAAFDAGFRIGPSSLAGYVDDKGEITVAASGARSGSGRVATSASLPPPPAAGGARRHTERMMPGLKVAGGGSSKKKWLIPTIIAAMTVVGGIIGTMAWLSSPPEKAKLVEAPPQLQKPVVPPPLKAKGPGTAAPPNTAAVTPTGPSAAVLDPTEDAAPLVEETAAPTQGKPVVKKSKSRPVAMASTKTTPPPVPVPKSEEDEAIPNGEGRLRIAIKPQSKKNSVSVAGNAWGEAPLDRKLPSGRYTVTVTLSDSGKRVERKVAVLPDKVTALEYLVDEDRWSLR